MAVLTGVSYLDFASRMDPDNKIRTIIELLAQTNEILTDMVIVEGNLPTGHKSTTRTGLPTATWRLLNYGVQPSKSITSQVTDTCGMLEAYAEVDKDLAMLNGNTAAWRLSEDQAFLEAMNQQMAQTLFYGSQITNPERFTGLMPRYDTLPPAPPVPTVSTYNCINAYPAAAGVDQSSMWLVVWGENTVHGIYPKGSQAGFVHEDLGEVTLLDALGGRYQGYRTHYQWKLGLTVRDWRYVVRICNIDTSAITAAGVVPLLDAMSWAYDRIPSYGMGRAAFYANGTIRTWLWLQAVARANVQLTIDNPGGKPVLNFLGIPIRKCDQITNIEAVVV